MKGNEGNLLLAFALSMLILIGYDYLFLADSPSNNNVAGETLQTEPAINPTINNAPQVGNNEPQVSGTQGEYRVEPEQARRSTLTPPSKEARYQFQTEATKGSINLIGAQLDDLTLTEYKQTLAEDSPKVKLLTPEDYSVRLGWASGNKSLKLPNENTLWQASKNGDEIILKWDNKMGLQFEQVVDISQEYLFKTTQRVTSTLANPVSLAPYGLIVRRSKPQVSGFFILHEGAIAYLNDELVELDYEDIEKQEYKVEKSGWLGITDKYWLTALVPTQNETWKGRFIQSDEERYQADFLAPALTINPNETIEYESLVFAGAKELDLLDDYQVRYQIPRFELAVDFGWFYFLTKPIFYLLNLFSKFLGNFGLAILVLTVLMRLLLYPLANKSFITMHKMKTLQPEMVSLQKRFAEDKAKLRLEMMALYKKHKLNPAAGCLPVLLQIPIFFSLYKVLFISIEMRQAPFYLWVKDLSAPDPTSVLNLFGLLPFSVPSFLGILPILMGLSIFIQQKLSPKPTDPIQAKIMSFLPWVFMLFLASFPSGLLIYWTWNNILSILQQYVLTRRLKRQNEAKEAK